ncbi:acyl-CoA synthetase [Gordonia insulae]|uniref:Long-chain-fatty-acid--CoA ligase FadD13 n=1 Tax=Gordonia insulae TaxID=2420509 RepID=A0A3G8JQ41_9ACTN|nr:long-chain fatty acid--CoA ligase [Gordonia insulae]AZG46805.1 Long-chain-fatty-acid--CoA ligase FadD13 [Gordonia insulae]
MANDIASADTGLGSWPWRRARITPDRIALIDDDRSLTYRQLADNTERLASAFRVAGLDRGARVAYLGPNDIAAFESLFAAGLGGHVFVPLNTRLSAREIDFMLEDCSADVLIVAPSHHDVVEQLTVRPSTILTLGPGDDVPGAREFRNFMAQGGLGDGFAPVGLDDPCLVLYTSGTTGLPKGAVLTHGNLTFNTVNQLAHLDVLSSDRALGIAPMFHVTGLNQVTLPTLFKGGSVRPVGKFDAGTVLKSIEEHAVNCFSAVPTILQMLCEHPSWQSTDISTVRYVIYGGSPVIERVAKAWLDRGVQLLQGYGMTEAAAGIYLSIADGAADHPVSVGFPHFYTDVGIAKDNSVHPVTSDDRGELLVRGPNVFSGYLNRSEATDSSFDGDWFRTGDVIATDHAGWTSVVDRVKDIIISGGENIYPAEVEAVLTDYPGVVSAAVVGVNDDKWGEVGTAFVVTDGRAIDKHDIAEYLAGQIARYKIPKSFHVVEDIPRSATGKILRTELRTIAADQVPH